MHRISLFIVAAFSVFQNTGPQILKSPPLPDAYEYDDISVSAVIENWDESRQVYNYKIEAKNIGNNYFMYSYTRLRFIENIINLVKKDNPFYTKTVISPNEEFDLEFECSDQITQNNSYIYSYHLDNFDNSIVYEDCVGRIEESLD